MHSSIPNCTWEDLVLVAVNKLFTQYFKITRLVILKCFFMAHVFSHPTTPNERNNFMETSTITLYLL